MYKILLMKIIRLGSFRSCPTCNLNGDYCPGHIGHVELPIPLYNPIVFPRLYQLLKLICFSCHHFRIHKDKLAQLVKVIDLVSENKFDEAMKAEEELDRLSKPAKTDDSSHSSDEEEEPAHNHIDAGT